MMPVIILAIADENDRAFMTELYEQYGRLMLAEIRKLVSDRWDADDIFQTTLEKLIDHIDTLRAMEPRRLVSYIVTAARHNAISHLRRAEKDAAPSVDDDSWFDGKDLSGGLSAEEAVLKQEQARSLSESWSQLGEKPRYLLEARYILGMSTQEIADSLHLQADTVKVQLSRARKQARSLLTNQQGEEWRK